MQVPGQLRRALARAGPRAARRAPLARAATLRGEDAVATPAEYAALLTAAGAEVDVWETTYLHRLTGPDPVLDWIELDEPAAGPRRRCGEAGYAAFRAELAPRLRRRVPRAAGRRHLVPVPPDLRRRPRVVTGHYHRRRGVPAAAGTPRMVTGLVFALLATVLNSVAGLLESDATRHAVPRRSLATQPRYLGGLLVDGLGWASTVVALRYLPVFVVQAVLGGAIALTALGARVVYGSTLRRVDRLACAACVAGLVLVAASAGPDRPGAPSRSAMLVLAVVAVLLVGGLVVSWSVGGGLAAGRARRPGLRGKLRGRPRGPPQRRSGARRVGPDAADLPGGRVRRGRPDRVVPRAGTCERRPGHRDPARDRGTVPGAAGIVLLGDSVRPGWWGVMIAGLVLAVAGVTVLADSPAHQPPS